MNVQFRKLYLPPLPQVNANALIELAGNDGNNNFKTPSLPIDIPKNQQLSRSNLDEIIQDIESDNTKNITALEWVHCIYNKHRWDAKNPDRSQSTSIAIWQAAKQNFWLKQKLFWNLVLHYSQQLVLAESLAENYHVFNPHNPSDQTIIDILQCFNQLNSERQIIKLSCQVLLTPTQLFEKYQLPTKIPIIEKSLSIAADQFASITNPNQQQIQWILKCLDQMSKTQQVQAVENLLTKVDYHLASKHSELVNWLRQNYGSSVSNSRWSELSSQAKAAMRRWIGAVSYRDFQQFVNLILDRLHLPDVEKNRLKKRRDFWSNYSDRFQRIRILLPQCTVDALSSHLNHQDVSILLSDGSEPTEICIFDFGSWIVAEFFRGNGSETRIFPKEPKIEQKLFHSELSVKRLRYLHIYANNNHVQNTHDHEFVWQYFCELSLRTKGIYPNQNVSYFNGLSRKHGKYDRQTGLPKPSSQDQQNRNFKLERWRRTMAQLEKEARDYCSRLNYF